MMDGISHITFIVRDLERMTVFLCEGLGAKEVYDSNKKNYSLSREKFFLLGNSWITAMEGEPPTEKSYQHVAFKVSASDLPKYKDRLQKLGVEMKPSRSRIDGEGESLYFYDFDNHLFELHSGTLEERLASYRAEQGANPEDATYPKTAPLERKLN
jgi:fosfomycin resistance protein FosX